MRSLWIITFFVCITQVLCAQVSSSNKPLNLHYDPSQADIKAFMNNANHKLAALNRQHREPNCQVNYDINDEVNLDRDHVCMMIPEATIKNWLIADGDAIECELQQNNDASVWKMNEEGKPNSKLSDDVGYTLGINAKCGRENSKRKWTAELNTDLFTRKVQGKNQSYRNPEGRYYLQTLEQTQINFAVEEKTSDPSLSYVGQAGIRYETTGSKGLAARTQAAWHDRLERYKNLRYDQLQMDGSKLSAEAQIGIKKLIETDISKFYCSASATVMGGMTTEGKGLVSTKLEAQITSGTMGNRSKETPLFAAYLAREDQRRGGDKISTTSAEIGSHVWADKNLSVYVGMGRVIHRSPEYIRYTSKEEPIHSLHLRVKKSF